MKAKILLIEDDKLTHFAFEHKLPKDEYELIIAISGEEGLHRLKQDEPDLVLLDYKLPGGLNGLQVLEQIKLINSETPIIMITAYGSIDQAVQAIKMGAYDYVPKPLDLDTFLLKIERALEVIEIKRKITRLQAQKCQKYSFDNIVTRDAKMRKIIETAKRLATLDVANILICGESGVGKDLLAGTIHHSGSRAKKDFIEVNCGAIPVSLLESEIFGYERGAFTDAKTRKEGLLELADGGTLFLNEIGEIDPPVQVKLLGVIERKRFRRLGGKVDIKVDVNIIAATNRDLKEAVEEGTFRSDLYYRLAVVPIYIPPLRERKDDIMLLAYYFLEQFNKEFRKDVKGFSEVAQQQMLNHNWPGNVRELRNVVERAVILSNEDAIIPADLPFEMSPPLPSTPAMPIRLPEEGVALEEVEKELVKQALQYTGWNQTHAAKLLDISRDSLRYRMKKFGFL